MIIFTPPIFRLIRRPRLFFRHCYAVITPLAADITSSVAADATPLRQIFRCLLLLLPRRYAAIDVCRYLPIRCRY